MAERVAEVYDDNGDLLAYEYEDGAIRYAAGNALDKKPGTLLKAPDSYGITPFTSETATAVANKRWETARQAAQDGLVDLAIEKGLDATPVAAIRHITKAQASLSIDTNQGHASTKAAEFVMKLADYMPDRRQSAPAAVVAIQVNISPELAASEWQEDE